MSIEISCDEILKRLASLLDAKTDIELSKKLGVASQTVSTWRNRNKIPFEKVVEIGHEKGVSLDLLINGQPAPKEVGLVDSKLMSHLFERLDEELFLGDRIKNGEGFDLLCRAYNSAVISIQGDINIDDPKVLEAAEVAAKDVIDFYEEMMEFLNSAHEPKPQKRKDRPVSQPSAEAISKDNTVSQTFHGDVGQVGGGDINNDFSNKGE